MEISRLQSRYRELTANLHAKNQVHVIEFLHSLHADHNLHDFNQKRKARASWRTSRQNLPDSEMRQQRNMQERVRPNSPQPKIGYPLRKYLPVYYFLLSVEEKRQQLERELSSLRSDLAAHDDDGILVEQKRKVMYYDNSIRHSKTIE